MKKTFSWAFIFLSLFAMTGFTVAGVFNDSRAAYAKISDPERVLFLLEKNGNIANLFEDKTACSITPDMTNDVLEKFGVTVSTETISENTVDVVKILADDDSKKNEIKNYIESMSGVECKVIKAQKWYYLMFSANMS